MTQLAALLFTLAIEVPLVVAAVARGYGPPPGLASPRRGFVVALLLNLATHTLAWHAHTNWAAPILLVEGGVVVAEALVFARALHAGALRGTLLSVAANGLSYGLGRLIGG